MTADQREEALRLAKEAGLPTVPFDLVDDIVRLIALARAKDAVPAQDNPMHALRTAYGAGKGITITLTWKQIEQLVCEAPPTPAKPPKHKFWGAGESDCPRDILAGNGELHSLRCKVCGETDPPDEFCWNATAKNAVPDGMVPRDTLDFIAAHLYPAKNALAIGKVQFAAEQIDGALGVIDRALAARPVVDAVPAAEPIGYVDTAMLVNCIAGKSIDGKFYRPHFHPAGGVDDTTGLTPLYASPVVAAPQEPVFWMNPRTFQERGAGRTVTTNVTLSTARDEFCQLTHPLYAAPPAQDIELRDGLKL